MTNFITAVSNRRTNYTLSKDVTIPQETITKTIEDVIREVPSAFNMQSGKAVIAFVVDDDAAEVLIYTVTYGGADWAMRTTQRRKEG